MAETPLHIALGGKTRFGLLTVLSEADPKQYGDKKHRRAHVRCDCGQEKVVAFGCLKKGSTVSCGCQRPKRASALALSRAVHGHNRVGRRTPENRTWMAMKARCNYPKHRYYANYGGRGIKVCERWSASFQAFLDDMGLKPDPAMTIDRIDNDRGYEPGNCRWATRAQQNRNRKT